MKPYLITALCWALLSLTAAAQNKDVNEKCNGGPDCKKGLYCVQTIQGKKCATCDQSTLDRHTAGVNTLCKTLEGGWTPEKSTGYKAVEAADKRVPAEIYDDLLKMAKACKDARMAREKTCWKGGDKEHKTAMEQVEASIKKMSEHKYTMISAKRVYYSNFSTYQSKLSTLQSKIRGLKPAEMQNILQGYEKRLNSKGKINCRQLAENQKQYEAAYYAAKDMLSSCFRNTISLMPAEYSVFYTDGKAIYELLEDLQEKAKKNNLCE